MQEALSQKIEDRIADFIRANSLNSPYGGTVSEVSAVKGKKGYKSICFARPRLFDGEVRVYGPTFILVRASNKENKVCKSEEEALKYLKTFVSSSSQVKYPNRIAMWIKPKSILDFAG